MSQIYTPKKGKAPCGVQVGGWSRDGDSARISASDSFCRAFRFGIAGVLPSAEGVPLSVAMIRMGTKSFLFRAPCLSSALFHPTLHMRTFPAVHPRRRPNGRHLAVTWAKGGLTLIYSNCILRTTQSHVGVLTQLSAKTNESRIN